MISQRDNRLNLEMARIAHQQNRTNLKLARLARKDTKLNILIASLSRRDSVDMRVITWITLIFLPGTFTAVSNSSSYLQDIIWNMRRPCKLK
jgi:hypothetical protein